MKFVRSFPREGFRSVKYRLGRKYRKIASVRRCVSLDSTDGLRYRRIYGSRKGATLSGNSSTTAELSGILFYKTVFWPNSSVCMDSKGALVLETGFNEGRMQDSIRRNQFTRYPFRRVRGVWTCIDAGIWRNHYHWLVDSLPRLYMCSQCVDLVDEKVSLATTFSLDSERRLLTQSMLPAGVDIVQVKQNIRLKAEKYLFLPYLSRGQSGHLSREYLSFFRKNVDLVFPNVRVRARNARIFVSRSRARYRKLNNEYAVQNALKEYGFDSYLLEDLHLSEQIELFRNASIVVGVHGAGLTNIIFSEKCRILELFSCQASASEDRHYGDLAESMGHNYVGLYGDGKRKNENFSIDVQRVILGVEHFLSSHEV